MTEQRVLLIALGNPLRGDDGAARRVLDLLTSLAGVSLQAVLQLTPELAQGLAEFDLVVFIDADAQAEELRIEPASRDRVRSTLTHGEDPGSIVALADALFGFKGQVLLCRIPAEDFSPGEVLSAKADTAAAAAACLLEQLLQRR